MAAKLPAITSLEDLQSAIDIELSDISYDERRKMADAELDAIAEERMRETRFRTGNKRGPQSIRLNPEEIRAIEEKYGVFEEK